MEVNGGGKAIERAGKEDRVLRLGGVAGTLSADLYTALLPRGEDGVEPSWSGGNHSICPDYGSTFEVVSVGVPLWALQNSAFGGISGGTQNNRCNHGLKNPP